MGILKPYKSYNFINKDPVIDRLRTAYQDARSSDSKLTYKGVQERSGVSTTTMHNWFKGPTRRPQFATVVAFARAVGCDVHLVNGKGAMVALPAAITRVRKRKT